MIVSQLQDGREVITLLMKQQLKQRLEQLKSEFESGQKVLADLETKQINVQQTLLRIQGAIQVLEEELAREEEEDLEISSPDDLTIDSAEVSTNTHG